MGKRITDPALQGLSYYQRQKLMKQQTRQQDVEPEVVETEDTMQGVERGSHRGASRGRGRTRQPAAIAMSAKAA